MIWMYRIVLLASLLTGTGLAVAAAEKEMACDCCKKAGKADQAVSGQADISEYNSCAQCGMHRDKFAHSRVYIQFSDGSSTGTCSVNCAAVELKGAATKTVKTFMVGDYLSRELIDAKKAFWVMGGEKAGVMTRNPKWAFAEEKAAQAFVKENGGRLVTFDEVLQAAMAGN
jgi:copper chaperone NosL